MSASYLPCEIGGTIPRAGLLPGSFVFALFFALFLAVVRRSMTPPIHRDRRKGVCL